MQLQHCGRDGQDHVLVIHNAAIDLEGMTMQLHTYSISYKKQAYPTMTTRDILSTILHTQLLASCTWYIGSLDTI